MREYREKGEAERRKWRRESHQGEQQMRERIESYKRN